MPLNRYILVNLPYRTMARVRTGPIKITFEEPGVMHKSRRWPDGLQEDAAATIRALYRWGLKPRDRTSYFRNHIIQVDMKYDKRYFRATRWHTAELDASVYKIRKDPPGSCGNPAVINDACLEVPGWTMRPIR
ncbi:MAG: hypothetical protein MPK62_00155 [Alphaproteobacteria bacterium]|nr:hypothetical protein [Alphaproteobacteria bacterium]